MTIRMTTTKGMQRVDELLAEIMGKAVAHAYTSAEEIISSADDAVRKLGIPATHMGGIRVELVSGRPVASSYRGRPIRTRVVVEAAKSKGWILVEAERWTYDTRNPRVSLNAKHREAIVVARARAAGVTLVDEAPAAAAA